MRMLTLIRIGIPSFFFASILFRFSFIIYKTHPDFLVPSTTKGEIFLKGGLIKSRHRLFSTVADFGSIGKGDSTTISHILGEQTLSAGRQGARPLP